MEHSHNDAIGLKIRRMGDDELVRIRDIDRTEAIRVGYEQRGAKLHRMDVEWDTPGWFEGEGDHSFARMIGFAETSVAKGSTAIGAFDGKRLAGIAIYRPRLAETMGQLALLHVSCQYRRQGVASRLFEEVLRLATGDGARRLYVSATPSGSAVGFYTSRGFQPTDTPDPELLAEEPQDIHMILEI